MSPRVHQEKATPEITKPKHRAGTSLAEVVARMNPDKNKERNESNEGYQTGTNKKVSFRCFVESIALSNQLPGVPKKTQQI